MMAEHKERTRPLRCECLTDGGLLFQDIFVTLANVVIHYARAAQLPLANRLC